jgi:hypothetical protein
MNRRRPRAGIGYFVRSVDLGLTVAIPTHLVHAQMAGADRPRQLTTGPSCILQRCVAPIRRTASPHSASDVSRRGSRASLSGDFHRPSPPECRGRRRSFWEGASAAGTVGESGERSAPDVDLNLDQFTRWSKGADTRRQPARVIGRRNRRRPDGPILVYFECSTFPLPFAIGRGNGSSHDR